MGRIQRQSVLLGLWMASCMLYAETLPPMGTITLAAALVPPSKMQVAPCAAPTEPFNIEDYNGPFNRLVGRFTEHLESGTVHVPKHRNALQPCALNASGKFHMFLDQQKDPFNFLGATIDAATAQASHDDPSFGQGFSGYSKQYAAAMTDRVTGDFFGVFLYPAIFHQDPRYYRQGQGSFKSRLGHALSHRFITTTDTGRRTFNSSEWAATISSKALSNLYHPGNLRGFGPTASRVGFSVAGDVSWDVVREFWPEIARKLRLPFRTHDTEIAGRSRMHAVPPLAAPAPVAVTPPTHPAVLSTWTSAEADESPR